MVLKVVCVDGSDRGADATPLAVLARYGKAWARRTGARLQHAGAEAHSATAADVLVIRPAEMPRWAAAGKLLPVPQEFLDDHAPYAWSGLLTLLP